MIGHKNNRTKETNKAPIPEDNEQYCFRMPLKLEVHKRYWTTLKETNLGVAEANADSKRDQITNQNSFFLVVSSYATLNETLTAKNNDIHTYIHTYFIV